MSRLVGSAFIQEEAEVVEHEWTTLAESARASPVGLANSSDNDHAAAAQAAAPSDEDIIVQHLTSRLAEVAGRVDKDSSPEHRLAALQAAEPVLLQLQHAVRARAPSESEDNSVDRRPDKDARCFACIYIMQKTAQNTAPYFSPTSSNSAAQDMAGDFKELGKAPRGVPVSFPSRSAYAANRAPLAIESGPFAQYGERNNGGGLAYASLRRVITEPASAAPPKGVGRGSSGMNPAMWPELHYGDEGGKGGGGDANSFLQMASKQGPSDPMTQAMNWGEVPAEAYLLRHERPPIGPRVLPPIPTMPRDVMDKVRAGPNDGTPPASEMSHPFMTNPMPINLGVEPPSPPPLVPQALFRGLDSDGLVQPPAVPYMPGLSFAPKTDLSMLDAPQFPTDIRSVDEPPKGRADPLMFQVPAGALLQTGGTPDEERGVFGHRQPWDARLDQQSGTAEPLLEGRHEQMQGSRDGMSSGEPDAAEPPTTAAVAEDDVFGDSKPTSGVSPNTVVFAQPGAGRSEPLEKPGKGMFASMAGAMKKMFRKPGAAADPDAWLGPWVKATRKEVEKAQERRSPPESASPLLVKDKLMPFGASFNGGEGADRFDQPEDIARVVKKIAKHGRMPSDLKAKPLKKALLGAELADQEAGLFSKPRLERDAINDTPSIHDSDISSYSVAGSQPSTPGGGILLQEQGRTLGGVRQHRSLRHRATQHDADASHDTDTEADEEEASAQEGGAPEQDEGDSLQEEAEATEQDEGDSGQTAGEDEGGSEGGDDERAEAETETEAEADPEAAAAAEAPKRQAKEGASPSNGRISTRISMDSVKRLAGAAVKRLSQPDSVAAGKALAEGFSHEMLRRGPAPSVLLNKIRERFRPMPHKCRKGEKICRQRLRSPTPYSLKRKLRRTMHQSRMDELVSSWRRAIDRMCTVNPPLGQALPPQGDEEDSGSASWEPDFDRLQASLSELQKSMSQGAAPLERFVGKINVKALLEGSATQAFKPSSSAENAKSASVIKQLASQVQAAVPGLRQATVRKQNKESKKLVKQAREASKAINDFHKAVTAFQMWQGIKGAAEAAAAGKDDGTAHLAEHAKRMITELVALADHVSAFGPLRSSLRAFDATMESGYEGPRPPPRLQSEGLDSQGRVRPQPFTAWVTERNQFGDHPAAGQLMDLGMPVAIQQYCQDVAKQLELMSDLYLHGYDLEEMCVLSNLCPAKKFSVIGATEPTSIKARTFSRAA